jgi:hypothetical protein
MMRMFQWARCCASWELAQHGICVQWAHGQCIHQWCGVPGEIMFRLCEALCGSAGSNLHDLPGHLGYSFLTNDKHNSRRYKYIHHCMVHSQTRSMSLTITGSLAVAQAAKTCSPSHNSNWHTNCINTDAGCTQVTRLGWYALLAVAELTVITHPCTSAC